MAFLMLVLVHLLCLVKVANLGGPLAEKAVNFPIPMLRSKMFWIIMIIYYLWCVAGIGKIAQYCPNTNRDLPHICNHINCLFLCRSNGYTLANT